MTPGKKITDNLLLYITYLHCGVYSYSHDTNYIYLKNMYTMELFWTA